MPAERESVQVESRAELRAWLAANHTQSESIWLVTFKKSAGERYLPYDAIVEEALCFGWVDSQSRRVDDERTSLLLAPRKPKSVWSATNKARIERLIATGSMQPAGQAVIDAAIADGSWTTIDSAQRLEVPDDLLRALRRRKGAKAAFDGFPPSSRRAILEWIATAKRDETRARRVEQTADKAAQGERAR